MTLTLQKEKFNKMKAKRDHRLIEIQRLQQKEEEMPPQTIDEFLDKVTEKTDTEYIVHDSFFKIVVSDTYEEIFLWLHSSNMKELFFHQLTVDGVEGSLPDMFDTTPKTAGLYFDMAPNGMDVIA